MRLLLLLWLVPVALADGLERRQSVRPDFAVAAWRVLDGAILLIGIDGEVRTWRVGKRRNCLFQHQVHVEINQHSNDRSRAAQHEDTVVP